MSICVAAVSAWLDRSQICSACHANTLVAKPSVVVEVEPEGMLQGDWTQDR
jgi:hypothetical protein